MLALLHAHSKLEITSTDWHIFSIVPEDTLTANVGTIQREVLYLMLFFIGLSMLFLWLVLRMQGRQAKRLRRAKQFLETVIENIPGGFFRYSNDEKQEFDYISEGFLKLLGHTRASFREAYGNRFDNLVTRKTANACSTPSTARSSTAITIRWSTA